jgi:hypothetical protein
MGQALMHNVQILANAQNDAAEGEKQFNQKLEEARKNVKVRL